MTGPQWGSADDFPLPVAPGEDTFLEVTKAGPSMRKRKQTSTTTTTTATTLADLLAPTLKTPGWNFRERDPIRRHRLGRCELIAVPAARWLLWRRGRAQSDSPTAVRRRSDSPTTGAA